MFIAADKFKLKKNRDYIALWHPRGKHYKLEEDTIVYKKVGVAHYQNDYGNKIVSRYGIVKLLIPKGTAVFVTCGKCRAAKAKVLEIKALGRTQTFKGGYSLWDTGFKYVVGKTVKPRDKFSMSTNECESGIHFFRTVREARFY